MQLTRNVGLLLKSSLTITAIVTVALTWPYTSILLGAKNYSSIGKYSYPTGGCTSVRRDQSLVVTFRPDEFMSPIAVKLLADAHYGSGNLPPDTRKEMDEVRLEFIIDCLKPGAVIFVDTTALVRFFKLYYDKIKVPFVLVSGDSDLSAPEILDAQSLKLKFLSPDSIIIHWFAMNCNSNPDPARFTCLMNGISQWNGHSESMRDAYQNNLGIVDNVMSGNGVTRKKVGFKLHNQTDESDRNVKARNVKHSLKKVTQNTTRKEHNKKMQTNKTNHTLENSYKLIEYKNTSYSLLLSFSVLSNRAVREPIWNYFCNDSKMIALSYCTFTRMPPLALNRMISSSQFVLSPHGKGLDCYRTYEALYLGAYVVVRKSSLDEIYENLPVLIVSEWSDVTEKLLNESYHHFRKTEFDFDKLYTKYWFQRFRSFGYDPFSYQANVQRGS